MQILQVLIIVCIFAKIMESMENKTNEKVADWFLDIAKYIATAILISSFLGEFQQRWIIYSAGLVLVLVFFFLGVKILNKK